MGSFIKIVVILLTFGLLGIIGYLIFTKISGKSFLFSFDRPIKSNETSISRNLEAKRSPSVSVKPTNTSSAASIKTLSQNELMLRDAILNATDFSKVLYKVSNMNEFAENCTLEIGNKNDFSAFPGYQYSKLKAHFGPAVVTNKEGKLIDIDFRLDIRAEYDKPVYFKNQAMKGIAKNDSYTFYIDLTDSNGCRSFIPDEKVYPLTYREIVPDQILVAAVEIAKKNLLVKKRLDEQEYEIDTSGWLSYNDIQLARDDFFGDGVKEKLLSSNGSALVKIKFEHPIDQCFSYYFNSYVDIETEFVYVSELSKSMLHCTLPS